MDEKELNRLYRTKAADSFKTRLDLLLYKRIRKGNDAPIKKEELDQFEISAELVILKEYIGIFWQYEEVDDKRIFNGKSIDDIYNSMKDWRLKHKDNIAVLRSHYVNNTFNEVFPIEAFERFFYKERKCDYCQITMPDIEKLIAQRQLNKKHITRGWSLEIDRIKPNHEYSEDNCVWCCYWCNNAKTDEFTYTEFKEIGAIIEKIWHDRLQV